jgi:hypothetical protein
MEDKNKTSFILHIDSLCVLDKMTEQQAGILFKAIYFYQKNGTLPELDFAIDMAITPFVNQFKRDEFKYSEFIDKQKQNGSKGGRPRKNTDNETVIKNPQEPNLTQKTQAFSEKPKKAYKDSVSDSVSDNKKDSVSKFTIATVSDFISYFEANGYNDILATKAFNYYNDNNWKDSQDKQVKNWKSKVRNNWFKDDYKIKPKVKFVGVRMGMAYIEMREDAFEEGLRKGTLNCDNPVIEKRFER